MKAILTDPKVYIFILSLMIVGAGAIFAVDRLIMPVYTNHSEGVTVPDVTHMSIEEAEETLLAHGFRFEIEGSRAHEAFPADYVVDQSPEGENLVKPNRRIYLTINDAESEMIEVPDLSNLSLRNAEIQLRNKGLRVGNINYESERFQNTVLEQSVAAGREVNRGATIDLVISDGLGGRLIQMPEIEGLRLSEAQAELQNSDLMVGAIQFQERADVEPNIVLSYSPTDQDSIREGTEINLVVSEQPADEDDEVEEGVIVDTTDVDPDTLDIDDQ